MSDTASHDHHDKSNSWVPTISYEYGALLGDPGAPLLAHKYGHFVMF